ncbi:hypothetical protein ANO11243_048550 [Dothideomycetidae sp. 11243]|nr:hypothetical protein ANO11243_048550 [fungal sp. No.11243]
MSIPIPDWLKQDNSEASRLVRKLALWRCSNFRWGFVVAKAGSSYDDEARWNKTLDRLRQHVAFGLALPRLQAGGSDDRAERMAMDAFTLQVLDSHELRGAPSHDTIRAHLRAWKEANAGNKDLAFVCDDVCLFLDDRMVQQLVDAPEPSLDWYRSGRPGTLLLTLTTCVGVLDAYFGPDTVEDKREERPHYQGWMWVGAAYLPEFWRRIDDYFQNMEMMCALTYEPDLIPLWDGCENLLLDPETLEERDTELDKQRARFNR